MQDNIITISFADSQVPIFKESRGVDHVKFDTDDKYPNYLIYLMDKSAKHNSIVNSKSTYIFGGGLKAANADPLAEAFILKNNGLVKKNIIDIEAFGMCYIQAIPLRGSGFAFHHISYERMRSNIDNSVFYYKKDWSDRKEKQQSFPAFDPAKKEISIIVYKEYRPGNNVYGLPGFIAACNYIEADIEVSKHTLTNAQTGFSASKFINFYNGEPPEGVKRSIEERFKNKFGGSQGSKIIIGFNQDPLKRPTIDDLGTSDLTKEDFSQVDNLISNNLYAGHQITNPALFGIPPATKALGGNVGAEMKMAFDIFKNTYVASKKQQIEGLANYMARVNGIKTPLSLIDVEPVGYEFTEATVLAVAPKSWLLEKLGIDATKYTDGPSVATAGAAPVENLSASTVNDNIKNLTAKQHQQLLRIIRQYSKDQITRQTASTLLKSGLGLSDDEINEMLGEAVTATPQAFGSDDDVALLFAAHGESKDGYNVHEKRIAKFDFVEYSDVEDKIKIARAANPKATPAAIAKELNIEEAVVKEYVNSGTGGIVKKLPKFEIRYSYEKRSDVEGADILPTTRPFCVKMLGMNKFYTRVDIQNISQLLGYDVMLRAGGFWNNDGTIEYHCRHEFFSQIVIKKP